MASSLISLVFISSSQPIPLSYHTTFTVRKLRLTHFIIYSSHFFKTFPLATVSFTAKDPARVHGLHVVVVSLVSCSLGQFLSLSWPWSFWRVNSSHVECPSMWVFLTFPYRYRLNVFSKNITEVVLCCDL